MHSMSGLISCPVTPNTDKMKSSNPITILCAMLCWQQAHAQSQCLPPVAQIDLDINNVRTTILVGGDMWWNVSTANYEVPKGSGKHSLYAGALWIGGMDQGGQVKVAAQTYRQTGFDFWGGPLDTVAVSITKEKCQAYDRHWKVTKNDVQNFLEDPSNVTNDIRDWPGNGDPSSREGHYLAPFHDADGDGFYDHAAGDYPGYNMSGTYPNVPGVNKTVCNDYLFGDQTIWWVFNDIGDIHTSSGSTEKIGLEIRAQAFAFQTGDEVNNMTFYKYQIINRSSQSLNQTYFGQWVDPDLGYADDDYVGCDVGRGLGFCYNGDAEDETATGYGINPPAVGIDFFQGPIADLSDTIDNDRDGCVDCTFIPDSLGNMIAVSDQVLGEQIIMSKFVYYVNINNVPNGNPSGVTDFYHYLRGIWLDNQPMTFGGDGRDPNAPITNFMFPGTTDPAFPNQDWSEIGEGNPVGDRRFLQSAGPFTLMPGAVNYVTTGVVWARTTQGGPYASVELVKGADDKAQALFDNCFKLIDGPDAPDVAIRELDQTIIITLLNTDTSSIEKYHAKDPTITGFDDSLKYFDFQGYQVFQLKDASATIGDIGNEDRIRLLVQCDIRDGVAQLVNFTYDPALNANIPVEMVNGTDKGVRHSFEIKKDLFATGSTTLINHKSYFYTVVSYAYNSYKKYDPSDPDALDGQRKPYLQGRNNVKTYSAIPHAYAPEYYGQILNSSFGNGPYVRRIEGQGNGGTVLDFEQHSVQEILNSPESRSSNPVYKPLRAPALVKVYDPVLVQNDAYTIALNGIDPDATYVTVPEKYGAPVVSGPIGVYSEQVYPEWGLITRLTDVIEPGDSLDPTNGFLEATMKFSNPSGAWLTGLQDIDDPDNRPGEDWIRSGTHDDDYVTLDDREIYENVLNGTWAPYKLSSKYPYGPKWSSVGELLITLSPTATTNTGINSIDVVLTPDKSKWTRCAVMETGINSATTIGNARQFELRESPSIGKDGEPDFSISPSGMSWFPGYAINLETGERLNIAFGENSALTGDRSQDMKFNPTQRIYDDMGTPVQGGMHYIYIFGHNGDGPNDVPLYDSCAYIVQKLNTGVGNDKRAVWKNAMWCSVPLTEPAFVNLNLPDDMPSEVTVRLRVAKKYRHYAPANVVRAGESLTPGITYYLATAPVVYNGSTYSIPGTSFSSTGGSFTGNGSVTELVPINGFKPLYEFGTSALTGVKYDANTAINALSTINVVPNPYYAFSSYETSQLDNRIKIVNLPSKCTVSIFNLSGTLVRTFKRDVPDDNSTGGEVGPATPNTETSIDWDLKNQKGIPIASGMYLIHVDAGSIGNITLKWFGMIRPIDLDTF